MGFWLFWAKLGWSQHPTKRGSEASWPDSSVSGQLQRHVTPLVALQLMDAVLSQGLLLRGVCDDLLGYFM